MSAKKPWFKTRIGWIDPPTAKNFVAYVSSEKYGNDTKIRLTDARELTAEQAVERVLQTVHDACDWGVEEVQSLIINEWAQKAGMTATVVNGKVRVRKARKK